MVSYREMAPINCDVDIDPINVKDKTAIVTGGANGIGEAYVRALVAAGAHVCVGDLDSERGQRLESELPGVRFVKCNTTSWEDQIRLFQSAASFSPTGRLSYVVANAGIHRPDDVFSYDGNNNQPQKPDLSVIDVNLTGTLYTCKLASHYFIRQNGQQPSPAQEDTCLVLIGSGAAFLDCPRAPQYCATKWAMRGIMHSLRRTAFYYGSRVNVISPWYVKTGILSDEAYTTVTNAGVQFAEASDAGQCLIRILSDPGINGHSFFVSGKKWASRGFVDLGLEEYPDNALMQEIQSDQIKSAPVELGLFV